MTVRQHYARLMEWIYIACMCLSGAALIAITLIIPLGVFMRYAMNSPLSWPEPAAVVMMVFFSFIGGAAVYRANVHIAVDALVNAVGPQWKRVMGWLVDACMAITALFIFGFGIQLSHITWHQTMAEFPGLKQGIVYLPIPIAGLLTILFLVERLWLGAPPPGSIMYSDQAADLE